MLVDELELQSIDLKSTPVNTSTDDTFQPLENITKEDMAGAIALAARLEPETYEIHHHLQVTSGTTDDPGYLKAVMLLVSCQLRILHLTHLQKLNLERMYQEKSQLPNTALDAWIILKGECRPQFPLSKLLDTYPGLKKDLPIGLQKECRNTNNEANLHEEMNVDSSEGDDGKQEVAQNEENKDANDTDSDVEGEQQLHEETSENESFEEDHEDVQEKQPIQIKWPLSNLRRWFY